MTLGRTRSINETHTPDSRTLVSVCVHLSKHLFTF